MIIMGLPFKEGMTVEFVFPNTRYANKFADGEILEALRRECRQNSIQHQEFGDEHGIHFRLHVKVYSD